MVSALGFRAPTTSWRFSGFTLGRKRGLDYEIANQEAAIGLAQRGILAQAHVAHAWS